MPHIAAFITPHGYGHAAIMAAVVGTLWERRPDLEVTFITTVPETFLRTRLPRPFAYRRYVGAADFGMRMTSATAVLATESLADYRAAHADWPALVAADTAVLRDLKPDLVLSCIGYTCLAAAAGLGLPGLGVGPFLWSSILSAYCEGMPGSTGVQAQMEAAYASAAMILETAPAVPSGLANARPVGPVGRPATVDRSAVREQLGLASEQVLALLALGGIPEPLDMTSWPVDARIRWLSAGPARGDTVSVADAGLSVSEAVAAADAVVTKPGYGTFVEAVCGGTAVLYKDRPDWPESAGLHRWAADHVPVFCIDSETFSTGGFQTQLHSLVQAPRCPLSHPYGNDQAADLIESFL